MQALLVDYAISMSAFKSNPAAVLRAAAGRPIAVLNHNRVGFYLLEPAALECLLNELLHLQGQAPRAPDAVARRRLLDTLLSQDKAADN